MKLSIYYDNQTDTLSFWNGQPANEGVDVAESLTADLNVEGAVVAFTLERAAELLEPVLDARLLESADTKEAATADTVKVL